MMSNLQKFGAYTLEAAVEEKDALDQEGGGEFMKLGVGKNVVRILPPLRGKSSPFRVTYQHYIDTSDGKWVFTCPRLEAGKRCPVCDAAARLKASGNPTDRDQAWDMFPRRRVFCSVINRAEPEKGVLVLAFGKTIHEELVKLRQDEDTGGDFTHPTEGIDVVIEREGTGKNDTRYSVNLARRSSPVSKDPTQLAAWADAMPDLDSYARLPSDDELEERMAKAFGPDGPAAAEPPPARRGRAQQRAGGRQAQAQGGARKPGRRTAQDDVSDAEFEDEEDGNEDWGMPGA